MPDSLDPSLDANVALEDMKEAFVVRCTAYQKLETYWRRLAFQVSIALGLLPVMAGIVPLLPTAAAPWISLLIAVTNVIVVVVNVKMDMGERMADAKLGGQGFDKLSSLIDVHMVRVKVSPESASIDDLLAKIRSTQESLESYITYPVAVPLKPKIKNLASCGDLMHSVSTSGLVNPVKGLVSSLTSSSTLQELNTKVASGDCYPDNGSFETKIHIPPTTGKVSPLPPNAPSSASPLPPSVSPPTLASTSEGQNATVSKDQLYMPAVNGSSQPAARIACPSQPAAR